MLQNFGMLVPIEKRRHEVYVPKVLQEGSESDDGQDVQSVSDKEEQSVDAFENDPGSGLCTQCYRKETKIREGKIDMERLKKAAGITVLRKKSDVGLAAV